MRRGRFPVPKSLTATTSRTCRLTDIAKEQPTGLDFAAKAQDLVFYGKTMGRGRPNRATATLGHARRRTGGRER